MSMIYKDENGDLKKIMVKAQDNVPVGTIMEYDGDTVPEGYIQVEDNSLKIKSVVYEGTTNEWGNITTELMFNNIVPIYARFNDGGPHNYAFIYKSGSTGKLGAHIKNAESMETLISTPGTLTVYYFEI